MAAKSVPLKYGLLLAYLGGLCACQKADSPLPIDTSAPAFFRAVGTQIIAPDGQPLQLQGIAFGNEVWTDTEIPITHHREIDFLRVKNMGMNVIRFYLNYKTFESDNHPYQYKQSGWNWLDLNISWAEKHGIYLILNMHVPQGGFQSQGNGDALWNNQENQNRLAALWQAIADRYKEEPQIIGYGLINEPVPTNHISQWQQLAERLSTQIRVVDQNHLLFVERANFVKGQAETEAYNFPTINDPNVVYEFHLYDPIRYTHQLFPWAYPADGGSYPDESTLQFSEVEWYTATFSNPILPPGKGDWTYLAGERYQVTDPEIRIGHPALVGAAVGGRVYFDEIEINEYDSDGQFTQTILSANLTELTDWYYWSNNDSGAAGVSSRTGLGDSHSLFIEGSTDDCNLSNRSLAFQPKQGYFYQINGWMKGEQLSPNAQCRLRIDFLRTDAPIYVRNKAYLRATLAQYTNWGASNQVPVYLGEFGAGIHCFQNDKGGLQWVEDMLDLATTENLSFTYHTYHEDNFGLYFGYGTLPDTTQANQPLIDLLTQKLK